MAQIINKYGALIGWISATFNLLGRDLEGVTSVEYSDEQKIDAAYGAGRMPVGYMEGNYSAKVSMTIYKDEMMALMKSLPPGMRIQDIPPFPLVINYEHGNNVFKDVVVNCKFINNGTSLAQGDGKSEIKLDLFCTHIEWNV